MMVIALRTLRARWVGFAGAFIASMLAVTLVGAWAILFESGSRAQVRPERLSGSQVVVAGRQNLTVHSGHGDDPASSSALMPERVRLAPDLVPKIAHVRGVSAAIPDVSIAASLHSGAGAADVQAHGWASARLSPYTLVAGVAPAAGQVAVDRSLAQWHVGDRIRMQTATGDRSYRVSGVVAGRVSGPAVFAADEEITGIAGYSGRIDDVGVLLRPGAQASAVADSIRRVVPGADVFTGPDRGRVEFPDSVQGNADITAIAGSAGGIAVMVAIFVVASTLSVSIQQRYREIALLRAVAATPGQIRRMVAAETLLVGIASILAGIGPAILMARLIRSAFVHKGILQPEFHVQVGWIALVVTAGATLLLGQAAAFIAGKRAAKVHPTTALAESAAQPQRLGVLRILIGLVALSGGIVLMTVSMSAVGDDAAGAAVGMIMVFMVAIGLLGPIVLGIGAAVAGKPIGALSRVGGFLAAVHARSRSRRLASAMTPVSLCVALAFITLVLQATISHAEQSQGAQRLRADHILQATGPGIPADVVSRLANSSTVDAAVGVTQTQVETSKMLSSYGAAAVTSGRLDRVLDLEVRHGSVRSLQPGQVAVSEQAAPAFHAAVGKQVELRLGDGTLVHPLVTGIYARGLGFGDVVLPWSTVAGHLTTPALQTVYVTGVPAEYPGTQLVDRQGYRAQVDRDQQLNAWVNNVLLGTVVGFVAIAVANTFVMTMLERRREFALLRLVGTTSRQVLGMVRWEAGLVLLLGLGLGTAVGMVTMIPFCRTLGAGVSTYIPPVPALVLAGGTILVGLLSALLPVRKALQQAPIEAIGIRE